MTGRDTLDASIPGQHIDFDPVELKREVQPGNGEVPECFFEARYWAERFAVHSELPSLRVGFKLQEDGPYFTELTVYSGAGRIYSPWMSLHLGLPWDYPEIAYRLEARRGGITEDSKWHDINDLLEEIERAGAGVRRSTTEHIQ